MLGLARDRERGWMSVRKEKAGNSIQCPVAFMTCNSPPTADKPALFTHYDVETLFLEFGHGLHHMLTKVDYASISGISGVEWDAVELPNQFVENWCWEKEVLILLPFITRRTRRYQHNYLINSSRRRILILGYLILDK